MSGSETSEVTCGKLVLCTGGGGGNKNCCNCCCKPPQPKTNDNSKAQLLKQQAKNSARQAQVACQQALVAAEQSRISALLASACEGKQNQSTKQTLEIHTHPCSDCGSNQNNESNKIVLDVCGNSGGNEGGKSEQEQKPETIKICACCQKKNEKPQPAPKKDGCCCGSCSPCQHLTIKPGSGSTSQNSFVISVKKPNS